MKDIKKPEIERILLDNGKDIHRDLMVWYESDISTEELAKALDPYLKQEIIKARAEMPERHQIEYILITQLNAPLEEVDVENCIGALIKLFEKENV